MTERRLTNLILRIDEERIVGDVDEGEELRFFRGTINVLGETSPFDISSDEFSEKLRPAIFNAAGARAELLGSVDEIRTAISRNSEPIKRRYLTSTGWTDDFSRYLVPGGFAGPGLATTCMSRGISCPRSTCRPTKEPRGSACGISTRSNYSRSSGTFSTT